MRTLILLLALVTLPVSAATLPQWRQLELGATYLWNKARATVTLDVVAHVDSDDLLAPAHITVLQPRQTTLWKLTVENRLNDKSESISAWLAPDNLDVYEREPLPDAHPLRSLPNVVLTPHLGYATQEFFQAAYTDTVENIAAFAAGKPIRVLTAERNDSRLVR